MTSTPAGVFRLMPWSNSITVLLGQSLTRISSRSTTSPGCSSSMTRTWKGCSRRRMRMSCLCNSPERVSAPNGPNRVDQGVRCRAWRYRHTDLKISCVNDMAVYRQITRGFIGRAFHRRPVDPRIALDRARRGERATCTHDSMPSHSRSWGRAGGRRVRARSLRPAAPQDHATSRKCGRCAAPDAEESRKRGVFHTGDRRYRCGLGGLPAGRDGRGGSLWYAFHGDRVSHSGCANQAGGLPG